MARARKLLMAMASLAALALSLALPPAALAHERREVGKYDLVVGWMEEPAFLGYKNGISLRVENRETKQPVEGLEKTLKVEAQFGGQRRELELRAVFRQPGSYTADLVPTREGDYRFRFFGTIEGAQINETFDSADGRFNRVQGLQEVQFPEAVPAASQMVQSLAAAERRALAAEAAAAAAQNAASAAQTLAVAGVGLGALGVLLGGLALGRGARAGERAQP